MSDELRDLVDVTTGLEVWFPRPLTRHARRLMDALGVVVHVDPPAIRTGGRS